MSQKTTKLSTEKSKKCFGFKTALLTKNRKPLFFSSKATVFTKILLITFPTLLLQKMKKNASCVAKNRKTCRKAMFEIALNREY